MATLFIDNAPYEVKEGKNLLEACLSLGFNLPYFCWHPAMGSVGACRQCAVKSFKDEEDAQGKLVMACMEPVRDQARISISNSEAVDFRAHIIEWLMTNHPHDCAVCDEGGSCHLQDMTVMTGHNYRDYRFNKRTYRNQYLGPFLNHEMNRCIHCYRCVRFYKDYAGGKDLDAMGAHNHVYFGRSEDGVLENEFSGNLAEVCPTGVFTDKTLKQHYTRKWDMRSAPSVCQGCGMGCNIIASERYGELRQISSRFNGEVNGYFICDRGRFGYEFVNSDNRIREIALKDKPAAKDKNSLLSAAAAKIMEGKVLGVGSPRASLESNFALRMLVGEDNFYHGVSDTDFDLVNLSLRILKEGPAKTPTLGEIEQADAILILGEDLINTAPRMALALRQAVQRSPAEAISQSIKVPLWQDAAIREAIQDDKAPLYSITPYPAKQDELAAKSLYESPDDISRLGFAVAHSIYAATTEIKRLNDEERTLVSLIADTLLRAERPLIISGYGAGSEPVIRSAADVAWALSKKGRNVRLALTVPECNSMGLAMMGGHRFESALDAVKSGHSDTVIILENDLYRRAEKELADEFFQSSREVILLDHLYHQTAEAAGMLIPVATFAEADGTLVNSEGRGQRFFQVFTPDEPIQESWRWLQQLAGACSRENLSHLKTFDDFLREMARVLPQFQGVEEISPSADFRIGAQKIPRQPHRYSGRTAKDAHIQVSEPKPPEDEDTPLSFTMEGYKGIPPSSVIPFFWSPGWNSIQSVNKYQVEVGGSLHGGDPGKRLIHPEEVGETAFFAEQAAPFQAREGCLYLIPRHFIFGTEELSVYTPGIASQSPAPGLRVSTKDAALWGLGNGDSLEFQYKGQEYKLPLQIEENCPPGMGTVPLGLTGVPYMDLPGWVKLKSDGRNGSSY
ncbi:NADH dehydrogenase subunit G [Anseongella ginsenosidimutans]|uniref:NADH-quinone oxidoreductase subunit G n=1 Tax=Anseongella ginsenosidimutans TaxID=496056 RepID=A0A4R3KQQ0_9SPHI|nr:NADH-quinone oxidoreductase subunit NuoG [Anseongella ginsenosidimutans]QEC52282.1 NADH-quinone oxidoreductase subunit NuoG [Anseongella ginsenosidimutans]TCS86840.1 NADH dehydrogenase subunit G [Anseongella ginsenosidimutans]